MRMCSRELCVVCITRWNLCILKTRQRKNYLATQASLSSLLRSRNFQQQFNRILRCFWKIELLFSAYWLNGTYNSQTFFFTISFNYQPVTLPNNMMFKLQMWNIKINGEVFSHLQVYTDSITKLENLLFASKNSYIYKLECSTSPEVVPIFKMEKDTGVPMVATPCLLDEKIIVVVGTNGELKVLDFVTGESLNSFKLGGDVFSSPIIHDDFIVVGCRDNNLYVLSNTNSVPR